VLDKVVADFTEWEDEEFKIFIIFGLINELIRLNILEEITGYQRNRMFLFRKYIQLFR